MDRFVQKKLPKNLKRMEQRLKRHQPGGKKKTRDIRKRRPDTEQREHDALVRATEVQLKNILQRSDLLSDIPFDTYPEELLGEIAIGKGSSTTIYIERDGLSTLEIVLPQKNPTIANLKRAIESTTREQLKRELRERYENRCKRRLNEYTTQTGNCTTSGAAAIVEECRPQQVQAKRANLEPSRSTGEFIYSTTRCGHAHRPNVSWRFLWRAYALIDVKTKTPLNDQNGRKLLSEYGIENASTLRFCNRENYFSRRRQ